VILQLPYMVNGREVIFCLGHCCFQLLDAP